MPRCRDLAILLCLATAACAPEVLEPDPIGPTNGWSVFHPLPGGYDLRDVLGLGAANIWAVGANGVIVHWDGTTVRRVDSPVTAELAAIGGRMRDDLYACGGDAVLRYDGRVWSVLRRFPGEELADLLHAEDGRLYVVGTFGLWCRDAEGWRAVPGPDAASRVVWAGRDGLVRVGAGSWIWRLTDLGAVQEQHFAGQQVRGGDGAYAWTENAAGTDVIHEHAASTGWVSLGIAMSSCAAIADFGVPVRADNAGIHLGTLVWSNTGGRWIYGLARGADGALLACGYGGTLMSGEILEDAVAWRESAEGIGFRHINAFTGTGCDDIWAAEWYGRILHYDGREWRREYAPLSGDDRVADVQIMPGGWLAAQGGDLVALRSPAGDWTGLPSPGDNLFQVCALAPDSIIVATASRFGIWNGTTWRDAGPTDGICWGLAVTPGGAVHALVVDGGSGGTTLRRWNGDAFVPSLTLPIRDVIVVGVSRSSETLWLAGPSGGTTVVFRLDDAGLHEISTGRILPGWPRGLTELREDDLFVLVDNQVWRFHRGVWTPETGLPREDLTVIWSHPDCGVFVEGHPTFHKSFPPE